MDTNQPAEDEQDTQEENMEIIHDDGRGPNDEPPETLQDTQIQYRQAKPEREFEIFVKGCEVDITDINARRVQAEIRDAIDRTPNIVKVYKSLRIDCNSEDEKRTLMNTHYLAGHHVEFTEPYWKTRNNVPRKSKHRGIIFGVN